MRMALTYNCKMLLVKYRGDARVHHPSSYCMGMASPYNHKIRPLKYKGDGLGVYDVGAYYMNMASTCNRKMLPVKYMGDDFVVHDAGAYRMSMASTYNLKIKYRVGKTLTIGILYPFLSQIHAARGTSLNYAKRRVSVLGCSQQPSCPLPEKCHVDLKTNKYMLVLPKFDIAICITPMTTSSSANIFCFRYWVRDCSMPPSSPWPEEVQVDLKTNKYKFELPECVLYVCISPTATSSSSYNFCFRCLVLGCSKPPSSPLPDKKKYKFELPECGIVICIIPMTSSADRWLNPRFVLFCVATSGLVLLLGLNMNDVGSKYIWGPLQENLSRSHKNFMDNVILVGGFLNKLKEFKPLWSAVVSIFMTIVGR